MYRWGPGVVAKRTQFDNYGTRYHLWQHISLGTVLTKRPNLKEAPRILL